MAMEVLLRFRLFLVLRLVRLTISLSLSSSMTTTPQHLPQFGNCDPPSPNGIWSAYNHIPRLAQQPGVRSHPVELCRSHGTLRNKYSSTTIYIYHFRCPSSNQDCSVQDAVGPYNPRHFNNIIFLKCKTDNTWGFYNEPDQGPVAPFELYRIETNRTTLSFSGAGLKICSLCYNVWEYYDHRFTGVRDYQHFCQG